MNILHHANILIERHNGVSDTRLYKNGEKDAMANKTLTVK